MPSAPEPPERVPARAADTSAEAPWPLRLLALNLGRYLDRLPTVWVEGQLVEVRRRPGARTVFATLRDPDVDVTMSVMLDAPMLDRLGPAGEAGARVVILAEPRFDERRGTLALGARQLRAVGVGELLARIEALKGRLLAEGLFDPARKRSLPFLPACVGLVCGRASAAERDVVDNARARWPAVRFRIEQVPVQGDAAAGAVAEAVTALDRDPDVSVIVIARGGGSLPDLLPFSSEPLVRLVAACATPVVSAIGHEVDTPLLDLVADRRASTPTDAARLVVPDVAQERAHIGAARERMRAAVTGRLRTERATVAALRRHPALGDPRARLTGVRDEVAAQRVRARAALRARCSSARESVGHLAARLRSLSPQATLDRGYAVVSVGTEESRQVVRDAAILRPADRIRVQVAAGSFAATVAVDSGAPPP